MTGSYDAIAEELRKSETTRLTNATLPTIDGLLALNTNQPQVRVVNLMENLGYELLTPGAAGDRIPMKDGAKHIVAFASTTYQAPIAVPQQLTRGLNKCRRHVGIFFSQPIQHRSAAQLEIGLRQSADPP